MEICETEEDFGGRLSVSIQSTTDETSYSGRPTGNQTLCSKVKFCPDCRPEHGTVLVSSMFPLSYGTD
jgi:hypothetical protein